LGAGEERDHNPQGEKDDTDKDVGRLTSFPGVLQIVPPPLGHTGSKWAENDRTAKITAKSSDDTL